ncbi:MAG: hypothetical protein AAGK09_05735 [Planctomycetota bacterium]
MVQAKHPSRVRSAESPDRIGPYQLQASHWGTGMLWVGLLVAMQAVVIIDWLYGLPAGFEVNVPLGLPIGLSLMAMLTLVLFRLSFRELRIACVPRERTLEVYEYIGRWRVWTSYYHIGRSAKLVAEMSGRDADASPQLMLYNGDQSWRLANNGDLQLYEANASFFNSLIDELPPWPRRRASAASSAR